MPIMVDRNGIQRVTAQGACRLTSFTGTDPSTCLANVSADRSNADSAPPATRPAHLISSRMLNEPLGDQSVNSAIHTPAIVPQRTPDISYQLRSLRSNQRKTARTR